MPAPILQALVLADHVYQDKATNKWVIAGTFSHMFVQKASERPEPDEPQQAVGEPQQRKLLPSMMGQAGSPWVYLSLTALRQETKLDLRYVSLQNNEALLEAKLDIRCDNPLMSVEMGIPLPFRLPTEMGEYSLELHYEDQMLGSWRVSVLPLAGSNTEG